MKYIPSSRAILICSSFQSKMTMAFQTFSNVGTFPLLKKFPSECPSTSSLTFSSTSLNNMKVTINIDLDLPDLSIPKVFLDNTSNADSDVNVLNDNVMSLQQLIDSQSNSFTSLISSLSLPPAGGVMDTTNINNMVDFNSLLSIQLPPSSSSTTTTILDLLLPFHNHSQFHHPIISTVTAIFVTLLSSLWMLSFPPTDFRNHHEPYERGQYDAIKAREYYKKHPLVVIRRVLQLLRIANKWVIRWLFERFVINNGGNNMGIGSRDMRSQHVKDKEKERAQELLSIIQQIGPTAIKIGQALSVRPDLLSEAYTNALSQLQDNVPPFDSKEAKDILKKELGNEKFRYLFSSSDGDNYDDIDSKYNVESSFDLDHPVASASIGQVYKGSIQRKNKETNTMEKVDVAVKVQRPSVLSEIALDLFIIREIAPFYQKLTMNDTNLQSMADEWGRGFIAELTYKQEAQNTMRFNDEMKKRNLNAVCAPEVIEEFSSDRVLTTKWVHGVRLDKSGEEDVARLCGVALNAYLVMLLEIGTLHCDPHPGNLLRTEDGRLCILDFGMTLDTPKDLQYSLLEFIAHLTSENYDALPQDLVNLQFIKQEKLQLLLDLGLLDPMFYFFKNAAKGGGSSKALDRIMDEYREKYPGCNEDELREHMRKEIYENTEKLVQKASSLSGMTMTIEDLQRDNKDAFVIPEWFLYTSRAFMTLEGISLQADPEFSIVKSCFPYIAKRLIGDDSPRSQEALRNMLYGQGEHLNTEKIAELANGFTTYTTTTKIVSQGGKSIKSDKSLLALDKSPLKNNIDAEAAITLAKDSADIIFNPAGNLIQNVILEESATALHASMKDVMREILIDNPERLRASLPFGFLLPKLPGEQIALFLQKSQREEQIQTLLKTFPFPRIPSPEELGDVIRSIDKNDPLAILVDGMSPEELALIWKAIREHVPSYAPRVADLSGKVAQSMLSKVSEDIDSVISAKVESLSLADTIIRTSAKGISAAARAAAEVGKESSRKLK